MRSSIISGIVKHSRAQHVSHVYSGVIGYTIGYVFASILCEKEL